MRTTCNAKFPGEDYEAMVHLSLEDALPGTQLDLQIGESQRSTARIPKGATDGLRLRLRGQGGKGHNGGADGDLYLNIAAASARALPSHGARPLPGPSAHAVGSGARRHRRGADARWRGAPEGSAEYDRGAEAAARAQGPAETLGGEGDLYAIVQIVNPTVLNERERELFKELGEQSKFDPRAHFARS